TAHFLVCSITLELLLGFGLALLLNKRFKGHGFFSTVILLPMMLAPAVVGTFWKYFFEPQYGIFNHIVAFVGAPFGGSSGFKMFDLVDQLTNGGPGSVTELASIHLKREAFEKWRTGYASALGIILFVAIYGLSLVTVRFLERVKQR